jgi:hypothetical protein
MSHMEIPLFCAQISMRNHMEDLDILPSVK